MKPQNLALKILSTFLSFLLLIQAPIEAADIGVILPARQNDSAKSTAFVEKITLPNHLGEIKSVYAHPESNPTLIHIQDAHSNLSAQKSIREILHILSRNHNIDLVLFEGAFGELSPSRMDYFESTENNQKAAEEFEKEALISGGERFLLDKHWSKESARGFGVENPQLYGKNIKQFREVLAAKNETSAWLEKTKTELTTQASKLFSKNLRDFFREWSFYQDNHDEMVRHFDALGAHALKHLSLNLNEADAQLDWPQLARLRRLKDLQNQINVQQLKVEEMQLADWIEKNLSENQISRNFKAAFFQAEEREKTQSLDLRVTAEKFFHLAEPFGFSFSAYPELSKSFAQRVLQSELNPEMLFSEMNVLAEKIFGALAKTNEEIEILEKYATYLLLRKLFALELTREEYGQLTSKEINLPASEAIYKKALGFYETAIAREAELFARAKAVMNERGQTTAVLITGGFHSPGLSEKFKREFSYLDITPRISDLNAANNYTHLMTFGASPRDAVDHPHWLDAALAKHLTEEAAHMANLADRILSNLRRAPTPPSFRPAARSEVRNAQWDEGAALKAYSSEDIQTRAVSNHAAQRLKGAVAADDILGFIGMINNLKEQARKQDVPIGVINQMLFEVTKDDETLRDKVSAYFYFLNDKKEKASKEFTANDREAWNAIISLGIGHLMTVSPEMDDAKAGGMADVLTELYPELAEFGVSVTRVTLGYQSAQTGAKGQNGRNPKIFDLVGTKHLQHLDDVLQIHVGPLKVSGSNRISIPERDIDAQVFRGQSEHPDMETVYLYNRQVSTVLYPSNLSGAQTLELTLFLSRGALEYARMAKLHPGVIITNDWMTNLIPLYLRVDPSDTSYKLDLNFRQTKTIPMLHNAGQPYQMRIFTNEVQYGKPHDNFSLLNVGGEHYDGISDPGDHTHMNLVRAALTHSDGALAVSPGYLQENLHPSSVSGLHWFLQQKTSDVAGISNGLHRKWLRDFDNIGRENTGKSASSPDETLLQNYIEHLPTYKNAMKEKIQKDYSLPERVNGKKYLGTLKQDPSAVLVTMAARLADQKGVELLTEGIQKILDAEPKAQILIAGSVPNTGEGNVEDQFRKAMEALANNPKYARRFVFHPEFINPKELFLASDAFLMPSKDEPGGIAQLQALLAGAAVIGRKVGGIATTVRQIKVNRQGQIIQNVDGDGILFTDFTTEAFVEAAVKAIRYLKDDRIRPLISKNAASSDNFWETRIPYYLAFIQKIIGILNYDYPHLTRIRKLLADIQPHMQDFQSANPPLAKSELRRSLQNRSLENYLEVNQTALKDLFEIARLARDIFPGVLDREATRRALDSLAAITAAYSKPDFLMQLLSYDPGQRNVHRVPQINPTQRTAALAKLPKNLTGEALILDESFVRKGGLAFAATLFNSQPVVILAGDEQIHESVRLFNEKYHLRIPTVKTLDKALAELARLQGGPSAFQAGSNRALLSKEHDWAIRAELIKKLGEAQVSVLSDNLLSWMAQKAGISEFVRQLANSYTRIAQSA